MSVRLIDPARIYLLSGSYIQLGSGSVANDFSVSGTLYSIGGAVFYGPLIVSASSYFSGSVNFNDLVVSGNLTVLGTQTILNTDTLRVKDKTIELAVVSSPTDISAAGAGIIITGSTNKTFLWNSGTFQSSENMDLLAGHQYTIGDVSVLNSTTLGNDVISSSLQTLGNITSGTWNSTPITGSFSGTLSGIADQALIASSSASIIAAGTFLGNNYIFSLLSSSVGLQSKYIEINNTSDAKIRFTNTSGTGKPYDIFTNGSGQFVIRDVNSGSNRLIINSNGETIFSGGITASAYYGGITSASYATTASYALFVLNTDVTSSRAISASYADKVDGANVYNPVYSASNATSASYADTARIYLSSPSGTLLVGWIETASVSISASYVSTASHLDGQYWRIDNSGMFVPVITNSYDVGSLTYFPRTLFAKTSVFSSGSISSSLGYQIFDSGINSRIYNSASLVLETITNNQILFRTNGTSRWGITSAGTLFGSVDNTYDIGTTTNFRPKFVYIASGTVIGPDPGTLAGTRIGTSFNIDNIFYVDAANNLIFLGNSTGSTNVYDTTQIESLNNSQLFGLVRAGNDANGSYLSLYKSRGTSLTLTGSVQVSDEIGIIKFAGMPTNGIYSVASTITSLVNNVYSDRISSKLIFSTTDASTSGTIQNRIIIDDIGVVTIKSSSVSNSPLIVSGNIISTNKFIASASSKIVELDVDAIGTSTDNVFNIKTNNLNKWAVSSSGHLLAVADNQYDIGAPGLNRPRNMYIAGDIVARSFTGSFTGSITVATTSISATTSSYGMNNFIVFADPGGTDNLRVSGTIRSSNIKLAVSGALSGYGGVEFSSVETSSLQIAAKTYSLYGINATTLFWQVTSSGHLIPGTDITYDVGTSSNRIRNLYVGTGSVNREVVGSTTVLGVSTITEANNPNLIISDGTTLGSRLMEIKGPSVASDSLIEIRNTSGQFTINHSGSAGQGSITIQTNSTNRIYISGSGMIGLNTTTPKSTLHIVNIGSSTQKHIVFADSSTTLIPWNSYDGASTAALHIQTGISASLLLVPNSTGDAQLIIGTGSLRISTNAIPGTNAGTLGMTISNGSITIPNAISATSITGSHTGSVVGQLTFTNNILALTDNVYDIGQSGLNRPRNVYIAGELVAARITGSITGTITYATMSTFADTASFVNWINVFNEPVGLVSSSAQFKLLTDPFSGSFTGSYVGTLTGNASTATALQTSRLINGTAFDGSSNVIITASYSTLSNIPVGIVSSSTQFNALTNTSASYAASSSYAYNQFKIEGSGSSTNPPTLRVTPVLEGTGGDSRIIISQTPTGFDFQLINAGNDVRSVDTYTANDGYIIHGQRLNLISKANGGTNSTEVRIGNNSSDGGFVVLTALKNASGSTRLSIDGSGSITLTAGPGQPIALVGNVTGTLFTATGTGPQFIGTSSMAVILQTARLINGTSFDGSSNIIITASYSTLSNIPIGIVSSSTQFKLLTDPFSGSFTGSHVGTLTGNASTVTALQTARLINGTSFDGTSNIIITASYTTLSSIPVGIISSSTQLPIGVVSSSTQFKLLTDPFSGSFTGSHVGTLTGNASTATTLQTARLINGTSFDGGSNIIITASYSTLSNIPVGIVSGAAQVASLLPVGTVSSSTQASGWSVSSAATLTTSRLINGTSFNGSSNIIITGSYTTLDSIPVGIVSSSIQINALGVSASYAATASAGNFFYVGNQIKSTFGSAWSTTVPSVLMAGLSQWAMFQTTLGATPILTTQPLLSKNLPFYVVGAGDGVGNENAPGGIGIITTVVGTTSARGSVLNFVSTRASASQLNAGQYNPVQLNDELGSVKFGGDNSASLRSVGSQIISLASATWTATTNPADLYLATTDTASAAPTARWWIHNTGQLYAYADNTYDIGTSVNNRPRSIYVGTSGTFGANVNATSFTGQLNGNAATSTVLQTARLINGTSFNGSANIIITGSYTTLDSIPVGILSGSTQINALAGVSASFVSRSYVADSALNANKATILTTARLINGTSFDGSANIIITGSYTTLSNIPVGIISSSTQFKLLTDPFTGSFTGTYAGTITGNAATATALQTARLINGTSFDGTSNIIITGSYTTLSNIPIGIVSSSAQTISFLPVGTVSSSAQATTWAVDNALHLTNARLINGTSFDGSANIIITGSYTTLSNIPVGIVSSSTQITTWTSATSSLALSVSGTAGRVLFNSATNVTTTSGSLLFDGSNLTVGGQLNASTKSFLIEHRSKPGKKLMYGVVEGPEHSVFIRGILSGTNTIHLPEEWKWLVDSTSITVQLTPSGSYQKLYVKNINIENNTIIIGNENLLQKSIKCFYFIQATRKDVPSLQTVI